MKVKQVWFKDHVAFPHAELFIVLPLNKAGLKTQIQSMEETVNGVLVKFISLKEHRVIIVPWSNIKSYEAVYEPETSEAPVSKDVGADSKPAKVVRKKLPRSKKSSS